MRNLFKMFFGHNNSSADAALAYGIIGGIVAFLSVMMPKRSSKKIVAMILLLFHMPVKEVASYSGFKKSSVYALRKAMRELNNGADFLQFVAKECTVAKGRGRKSPIQNIGDAILEHIERTNCFTLAEIQQWALDTYEIKVSRNHLSKFLKAHDYRKLKSGSIPAKADRTKQKEFYQNTLLPLMEKASGKKNVLLFVDASHFVMGCDFIGCVYCKVRRFARSLSGRKRYNVLGALDYATKKVITVTNDKYINAESVCELLQKIRSAYKGKTIHIVLDNASYQKCSRVTELADTLRIHCHFLPPYSPNLNLIERLWRFTKTELRRSSWGDYETFRAKIDSIIDSTTGENKGKIDRLIGEKVQLYDAYVELDTNTYAAAPKQTKKEVA